MRGSHPERSLEREVALALAPRPGEAILIGASGGPDSAALAALAAGAARRAGASVVLGHVNHGVRSGAWQDEAVTLALGVALGVRVLCTTLEVGPADEATLREGRYAALAAFAREIGARRICTAHHAEDQTETVLLALFRGAGPGGLRGMPIARTFDDDLVLLRPLLRVASGRLAEHCRRERLPYARDPTNADASYRRNAVRGALSALRESFPRLDEAVARCAEIASDEASGTQRAGVRLRLRDALAAHGGLRDVTFERLDAAVRLIENGATGRVFIKPGVEFVSRAAGSATREPRGI